MEGYYRWRTVSTRPFILCADLLSIDFGWIDAICINQADLQEQNHQVGLMRHTYNRAALVIWWLGKEDEYTATAIQFIGGIIKEHVSAGVSLHASPDAIWILEQTDHERHESASLPLS
ncbi:hypothetical protein HO173_006155 [Letharia columbiana]|uniref:Heterokaryon incompatibility domain-containing protein n=1 Tax=Letharia columbiana TaxID=112416 RepID=A0A8H6L4R7_9LECA|nr:uncharacterized protein HO173_006155 [Letharia columbiana]KAF6235472.1 hypothetical protein HO173_006155 [Letharia columbiana]